VVALETRRVEIAGGDKATFQALAAQVPPYHPGVDAPPDPDQVDTRLDLDGRVCRFDDGHAPAAAGHDFNAAANRGAGAAIGNIDWIRGPPNRCRRGAYLRHCQRRHGLVLGA
jgi:hypothetical protein